MVETTKEGNAASSGSVVGSASSGRTVDGEMSEKAAEGVWGVPLDRGKPPGNEKDGEGSGRREDWDDDEGEGERVVGEWSEREREGGNGERGEHGEGGGIWRVKESELWEGGIMRVIAFVRVNGLPVVATLSDVPFMGSILPFKRSAEVVSIRRKLGTLGRFWGTGLRKPTRLGGGEGELSVRTSGTLVRKGMGEWELAGVGWSMSGRVLERAAVRVSSWKRPEPSTAAEVEEEEVIKVERRGWFRAADMPPFR
jgi:hypothetical protein